MAIAARRTMFLRVDEIIACGDSARRYQLCDMFLRHIPELSHIDACAVMGWVSDQGKPDQQGSLALVQGTESTLTPKCALRLLGCRVLQTDGTNSTLSGLPQH